ncbi:MAG TPA: transglutaminase family protein, partial [Kofleriaceae bacterium]
MRVLVQHRSTYHYPEPALLGPQVIRLRPADHARATIESYRLEVAPEHKLHWQRDPQGNHLARVTFKAGQRTPALDILVEMAVDVRPVNPFDFFVDDRAKQVPFTYPDGLDAELAPFLETGDPAYRLGRAGTKLVGELPRKLDTIGMLVDLVGRVAARVSYVIRDEPGIWAPDETLAQGRGSCRDSAALLVALLRARGIAARFVSGYLVQLADEGMIPDEPRGVGRDVVDLHAWAEAFVPGAGWVGLDGTSGLFCGEGHIPLAATATPAHAAPLEGTSELAAASVSFATSIQRLGHEARPTAPYTEDVWAALVAAGDRADAALVASGLTVWSGGEPTFVARDGQGAEQWQGGALGDDKWTKGRALAEQLRDRLAPGGVVLHRMGKHYPGEPLPRWALDVISRRDGRALWPSRANVKDDAKRAHDAAAAIARALGVDPEAALHAAYEDPWEIVRAKQALPVGVDAKAMDRDPGAIAGWVMPVKRAGTPQSPWVTQRWLFRRDKLFLLPGQSPIGLRLPLASLVGEMPALWLEQPNLPDPRRADDREQHAVAVADKPAVDRRAPGRREIVEGIKTAICVEARDGQL